MSEVREKLKYQVGERSFILSRLNPDTLGELQAEILSAENEKICGKIDLTIESITKDTVLDDASKQMLITKEHEKKIRVRQFSQGPSYQQMMAICFGEVPVYMLTDLFIALRATQQPISYDEIRETPVTPDLMKIKTWLWGIEKAEVPDGN